MSQSAYYIILILSSGQWHVCSQDWKGPMPSRFLFLLLSYNPPCEILEGKNPGVTTVLMAHQGHKKYGMSNSL